MSNQSIHNYTQYFIWATNPTRMPGEEGVVAPAAHQIALYCSHALAAWGQRMWEFAVGLILLNQFPSSFAAVAVAGVVMSLSQACCGASIGEFLDRYAALYPSITTCIDTTNSTPRLWGASLMYILQNVSVAFSASAALLMLALPHDAPNWLQVALVVVFIAGDSSKPSHYF